MVEERAGIMQSLQELRASYRAQTAANAAAMR